MEILICFLVGMLACIAALSKTLKAKFAANFLDVPNHRSLHSDPIPRIGGLGIIAGICAALLIQEMLFSPSLPMIKASLACYLSLYAISWIDDRRSLSIQNRLSVHFATVLIWIAIGSLLHLQHTWTTLLVIYWIFLCLGITWAMNLFNFMDGSDGLAGSMAVIGFTAYLLGSLHLFSKSITLSLAGIIGALTGFLYYNWPKAKLFLGDSGSIPIGFLAATIGILGIMEGWWNLFFPLQVFAMFWIDATFTLIRRATRGEKFWRAHKEHWYQRAIRAGNSHRKVLFIHCVCNTLIAALSLAPQALSKSASITYQPITIGLILLIVLSFGIWSEREFWRFESTHLKNL
jgi:UDP-N-acetylmuramyl pentapeptide phosphotransferase/UDP-N-acetylglucosamine-1-phosphate transferase